MKRLVYLAIVLCLAWTAHAQAPPESPGSPGIADTADTVPHVAPSEASVPEAAPLEAPLPTDQASSGEVGASTAELSSEEKLETAETGVLKLVEVYRAFRVGWLAGFAALVAFLTWLSRTWVFGYVFEKIPKRWRFTVPLVLGVLTAVLSGLSLGLPWPEVIANGLAAAGLAIGGHQALSRGLAGTSSSQPVKATG